MVGRDQKQGISLGLANVIAPVLSQGVPLNHRLSMHSEVRHICTDKCSIDKTVQYRYNDPI